MAKITYEPKGTKKNKNIYVRLSISRGRQYRYNTGLTIHIDEWSKSTKLPKTSNENLKNMKILLQNWAAKMEDTYNKDYSVGKIIDKEWLSEQISICRGEKKITDEDRLVNYFDKYIADLPYKNTANGSKAVTEATIKKYKTIRAKIVGFETHTKRRYFVRDVDLVFRQKFLLYLKKVEGLSENTVGRYIKFVKTVCLDARVNGIETNIQLEAIKGYTVEAQKIYFSFDEIQNIEELNIEIEYLDNARDWLVIGCYIGQRVSDLLPLTKSSIKTRNNIEMIELKQQKTGKLVYIPVHPVVKKILNKRNGDFPRKTSDQRFNDYIKKVAELAKINKPTLGTRFDSDTKEKITKLYPKHELVTSHICRRSFASNYYGEMPTSLIMTITGHSTEAQFLEYVGKPPIDHAQQIAKFINDIYNKQNSKSTKKEK